MTTKYNPIYKDKSFPELCSLIAADWTGMSMTARPYFHAMGRAKTLLDYYGVESVASITQYFLGNSQSWRGEVARNVKGELKHRLGIKQ